MSKETQKVPSRKEVKLTEIDKFVIEEGFNARTHSYGDIDALASQLKAAYDKNPYDIPPVRGHFVQGTGIIVTDGHRRILAARKAGIPALPYLPFSDNTLERLVAMSTMNSGERLTEMENARLSRRMAEAYAEENPGVKESQIRDFVMQAMGISSSSYYNYKKNFEFPQEILDKIEAGEISGDMVRELNRQTNSEEELVAAVNNAIAEVNTTLGSTEAGEAEETNENATEASNEAESAPVKGGVKVAQASKKKSTPRTVKVTRQSIEKAKNKTVTFENKSFIQKFEDVVKAISDSDSDGAQLILRLNSALLGTATLEEVISIITQPVEA